jgi:hypothetical protein
MKSIKTFLKKEEEESRLRKGNIDSVNLTKYIIYML